MRLMNTNTKPFYYGLYTGQQELIDVDGNNTGEFIPEYATPIRIRGNISAAKGVSDTEIFGISLNYDKVILLDKTDSEIEETSVLWVDRLDITKPHDYIVVRKAVSPSVTALAIRKVEVSH
jgi:hypothetical protein